MNETKRTTIFVVAALVAAAALVGFQQMQRSWLPDVKPEDMVGKQLFDDFEPLAVTSLQIAKYDEATGTPSGFEVSQVNNRWSIPSHSNYPTDAKDQLAEAAASVLGLKVLSVESDSPADHKLFGVLDPTAKTLQAGSVGVGTRVTMKGKKDATLIDLIIGKKVEGTSEKEVHYVRRAGQDPVYTMAVKTDKLSTKFADWIEPDLLKLNSWDIRKIEIRDHSVDEAKGALLQRGEITLGYDDTATPKWKMLEDRKFQQGDWVPVQMAADEELNTAKLDELKTALDDLKIVDVQRKPAGLSGDLKASADFTNNNEAVLSLAEKGFYVADLEGRVELVSNEGEVRCAMKDGVRYVLRFGAIDTEGDNAGGDKDKEKGKEGASAGGSSPNRYILVMAEFDPDMIAKPELQPLPEAKDQPAEKPADGAANDKAADAAAPDAKPTAEAKTAGDPKKDDANAKTPDDQKKVDANAEREKIQKENQRKQDEYDQKIADGKKHVKELNDRFADWYYVISDEVYRKIHLGHDQIVKKKETKAAAGAANTGAAQSFALPDAAGDQAGPGNSPPNAEKQPADPPAGGTLKRFEQLKEEGPGSK